MRLSLGTAARFAAAAIPALAAFAALLAGCSSDGDGAVDPPKQVPYPWSLDLDLGEYLGDTVSFKALKGDTSATASVPDSISGKVNGLDTSLVQDTLRFKNVEYDDFHVSAPLAADGSFGFEASDLLGGLDGSMTLRIWLKGKKSDRPPTPDTLTLELDRP